MAVVNAMSEDEHPTQAAFAPFQVDDRVPGEAPVLTHDLPARRGEEATAPVLDGGRGTATTQAGNEYRSARAVLEWCAG
jgi:ornithine carbamoyltransferase